MSSKREFLDDSSISINTEINFKKNELEERKDYPKLEIIEEESKNYVEDMKKGTYNIMVVVRCRPLSSKEKEQSDIEIVKILDRKLVILKDPTNYNGPNEIFKNRSREQSYAFDFAFDKSSNTVIIIYLLIINFSKRCTITPQNFF